MISLKTFFQILEYFGFSSAVAWFMYILFTGNLLAPGLKDLHETPDQPERITEYVFTDTMAVQRTQTRNKLDSVFLDYCKKNKIEIVPGY